MALVQSRVSCVDGNLQYLRVFFVVQFKKLREQERYFGYDQTLETPDAWLREKALGFGALSTATSAGCCGRLCLASFMLEEIVSEDTSDQLGKKKEPRLKQNLRVEARSCGLR
jgi:hypothetical protein